MTDQGRTVVPSPAVLPQTAVGLDVETTSLEPTQGEIIEVAAIRYDLRTGRELERFERLLKPQVAIPPIVTTLTGITPAMVVGQPSFAEIRAELATFIGDSTLFAHNASFDLSFLAAHGLPLKNMVWDTFLLAAIAWPEVASYNLGSLNERFQLVSGGAEHRAAADVTIAWRLLQAVRERLRVTPGTSHLIESVLQHAGLGHYLSLVTVGEPSRVSAAAAVRPADAVAPDALTVDGMLGPGGVLEHRLDGFTSRPEQVAMAHEVERALAERAVTFIEAGTGTGKTYAYAVPAFLSITRNSPIIISTHTRHLQDQLVERDLPRLLSALGLERRVAVLKGRRNYVCSVRLHQLARREVLTPVEALLMVKLLVWLDHGGSGDLERLNVSHQGTQLLRRVHADTVACRLTCTAATCVYPRARSVARQADVVVVNHALLARQRFGEETGWMPSALLIDEAHHLVGALREAHAVELTQERVEELLAPLDELARGTVTGSHLRAEQTSLRDDYLLLLQVVGEFMAGHTARDRLRLTPTVRRASAWQQVVRRAVVWQERLAFTSGLVKSVAASSPDALRQRDELVRALTLFGSELMRFMQGAPERVQWIEVRQSRSRATPTGVASASHTRLCDVPLSVSTTLTELTAEGQRPLILTSATLAVAGDFSFIKHQTGFLEAPAVVLPSSLPYRQGMLIYVIDDGPLPTSEDSELFVAAQLTELTRLLGGRTLGLMTSLEAVRSLYSLSSSSLHEAAIKLYAQEVTGGRANMLQRFTSERRSVLLGTTAFWEGVDVPGDSLSAVFIPRLPFIPPDDPIMSALAEAGGGDPFTTVGLPQMILKLRQGIGRLLRHESDRGVVVLLDRRITSRPYGEVVLKSLPPATIHIGSHRDLVSRVRDWFGDETISRWMKE